jgi:hypothetical protein
MRCLCGWVRRAACGPHQLGRIVSCWRLMNVLTFISDIVKALAWPIVSLVIAMVFRSELRALLHRIKKGKVGPAEFEFEETIAAIRDRVGKTETRSPEIDPAIVSLADRDPRSVILNSWLTIEAIVELIVAKQATQEERRDARSAALRVLHRLLRDKPEYVDMYNDLRMLRNQAVHDVDFSPRASSVIEYVSLTSELTGVLRPYAGE